MSKRLKVAVAGLGRMGMVHALHVHELARDTQACEFAALAEVDVQRARRFCEEVKREIPIFASVDELAQARICDAVVIVTPTDSHREHAAAMIASGSRVLLEKPLTGTVEGDREFAAELERDHPKASL
jgi:predicted dehydrogenase